MTPPEEEESKGGGSGGFAAWQAICILICLSIWIPLMSAIGYRWIFSYDVCVKKFHGKPTVAQCVFVPDYQLEDLYGKPE